MSDYDDRGAYTPPSDRLAFDPRQPVRGGGPAPVTLIVSGLVLASLVGGVFFLYRDGFRPRGAPPALVGAPVADVRTPAPPAADADAAPAGLTIDKTASAAPAPRFGPPPAQPLPPAAAPATQIAAADPAISSAAPPPPAAKAARPPVVMLHPEAAPTAASRKVVAAPEPKLAVATPPKLAGAPATKLATAPSPKLAVATPRKPVAAAAPKLAAVAPPSKAAAAPAPKLAAAASTAERAAPRHVASMSIASLADAAVSERARGERSTHELNVRSAAAQTPLAAPARRPQVASQSAAPAPTVAGAAGWVQIGAFSSSALADQGWHDLARFEPAAMAGKGRSVQPFTRDDGAILYRAYVTGFASVSAAQSFCSELRAAGKGCIVK
jgi:hypothetical protein